MGICCSDRQLEIHNSINRQLQKEEAKEPFIHRIIFIGPGDSGKTTILKQMRKIYSSDEKTVNDAFIPLIREHVLGYMKSLCKQSIKLNIEIEEKNRDLRGHFIEGITAPYGSHFNADNIAKMKQLWADEGIKETFRRRNEYQNRIPDNAEYFLNNRLDSIAADDYQVSFDDFVRIRMRTTGFVSEIFRKPINGIEHQFQFTDVGGQRSERNKWINMMHDDIDVVLYVVAVSEYDICCFEDHDTKRLDEALALFKNVIDKGFCTGKTVTLFFNKYDLLIQKLEDPNANTIADIYDDFPENKDARNVDDVIDYIYDKFVKIYKEGMQKQIESKEDGNTTNKKQAIVRTEQLPHHHQTTALDTEQIQILLHDIESDLINSRLSKFGF